ncbi:unnamed protein product [Pichia kudriavzevii]
MSSFENSNVLSPHFEKAINRRQSTAKLSSSLANTPASASQLTTIYRDRHSSASTNGGTEGNSVPRHSSSFSANLGSAMPSNSPRKPVFANSSYINTSTSPAVESDDESSASTSANANGNSNPTSNANMTNNDVMFHAVSPAGSYGSFVNDSTIVKNVAKHLPTDPQNALKLPSGDITRDLYQLNQQSALRRSKSNEFLADRRGSMASQMRLPGGFRRDFIQMKKQKFGYTLSQPSFLTKNFLEFLTIYGHFAGEDLEDEDFLACDIDTSSDKQDEESPLVSGQRHAVKEDTKKSSSLKAFFLLIKAFIGTGVLFLPKAFSNGGLVFCVILLFFFSVLSYFCYYFLAQSTFTSGISSFTELGNKTFGKNLKRLILISIVASQIGFVAAYTVFTAENLRAFVRNTVRLEFPLYYFVIFETICFAPMSLIRNITKLSIAALLANIFILTGIATIVFYTAKDLIKNGPAEVKLFNPDSWSLFVGVAIFAFEGIGLIIPIQQSMRNPEDFPKVLLAVISVCCFLFIGIGWLCYATYGEDVQTMVILNLPQDSYAVISIQFFYSLAIMLSVPLQLLPAIRLMEARLFKRRQSGRVDPKTKWYKNIFRVMVTLLTSTIAYYGSANLDMFVSFIGSVACIPLVYMYPPMIHYKIVAQGRFARYVDAIIVLVGGVSMVYTTFLLFV